MVGYAVPGSVVVGDGYIAGCGTKSYSGVPGETLCVSSGTPTPQSQLHLYFHPDMATRVLQEHGCCSRTKSHSACILFALR